MLRSLFSGVSGMKTNQTKMDVIGNNIANVNTTAFKMGRVTFKDMLSQTMQDATSPAEGKGGTNPKQAGLGVAISSIDTNMAQGALQPTGTSSDLAIEGNGFFITSYGSSVTYTRDGSFKLDKDGNLITSEGLHIEGIMAKDVNKIVNGKFVSYDADYDENNLTNQGKTTDNFNNIIIPSEAELRQSCSNEVTVTSGGVFKFRFVGDGVTNFGGNWTFKQGTGTSANIDSVDVDNKVITVSGTYNTNDLVKLVNDINYKIKQAGYQNCKVTATAPLSADFSIPATPVTGIAVKREAASNECDINGLKFRLSSTDEDKLASLDGSWTFKKDTAPPAGAGWVNAPVVPPGTCNLYLNSATRQVVILADPSDQYDLSKAMNTALGSPASGVNFTATSSLPSSWNADGSADVTDNDTVKLTNYTIEKDGTIKAIYGEKSVKMGKIALANFQNPAGLKKLGGNSYLDSANSGDPEFGDASSAGFGNIQQGNLEMSNVDLAEQFTDMIITSRAFQANSKTITTSDEMLQELLNLKR